MNTIMLHGVIRLDTVNKRMWLLSEGKPKTLLHLQMKYNEELDKKEVFVLAGAIPIIVSENTRTLYVCPVEITERRTGKCVYP